MITKDYFLEKYNIAKDLLLDSGISWEELTYIYDDFNKKRDEKYGKILDDFLTTYLKDIDTEKVKIHSIHSRVKDSEHLLAKIVRKKQENHIKYSNLDKFNYEKFITDLIGIRCLVVFKTDWQGFHRYILSRFENEERYYIKDSVKDFDSDENHFYIAERPKVHIRDGDARDIYEELLPPDSILDGKVYRSVHYIIKYKGIYLEIQVRTLFEEGWGEIDHRLVFPYYQNDKVLKEYTELLNRLSGLADEMGTFFICLKRLEEKAVGAGSFDNEAEDGKTVVLEATNEKSEKKSYSLNTPADCLKSVLDE